MDTGCQKQLPFPSSEITEQIIDLPVKDTSSPQILISEKEYLELKWAAGYWRGLHQKALLREEALKQTIKEQEGKIRDLTNRVFGKKSEKKDSGKKKVEQNHRAPNALEGSNQAARGMDVQTVPIYPVKKSLFIFQKSRYVLNAA